VAPFYHLDSDERAQVYIFYLTNYATKADISPQQILVKAANKEIPDISVEDRIYHEEAGPGPIKTGKIGRYGMPRTGSPRGWSNHGMKISSKRTKIL
jgi:hypothetical protein